MRQTYVEKEVACVGDWVEAHGISGSGSPRRGQIVSLLGDQRHRRYRVRWDEMHESILYPADGVVIIPAAQAVHPTDSR